MSPTNLNQPLTFIVLTKPQDQKTAKFRDAVFSHVANLRGEQRRTWNRGTLIGHNRSRIVQDSRRWGHGTAPVQRHTAEKPRVRRTNPHLLPPTTLDMHDASVLAYASDDGDRVQLIPSMDGSAVGQDPYVFEQENAAREVSSSTTTYRIQRGKSCITPLIHEPGGGNSDPFSALAISVPLGAALNQLVTWHRDVHIPDGYPYPPGTEFATSQAMQLSWQDAVGCLHTPVLADAFLACRAATMELVSGFTKNTTESALVARNIALKVKICTYRSLSLVAGQNQLFTLAAFRALIFLFWAEIASGDVTAAEKHSMMLARLTRLKRGSRVLSAWSAERWRWKDIATGDLGNSWHTVHGGDVKRECISEWEREERSYDVGRGQKLFNRNFMSLWSCSGPCGESDPSVHLCQVLEVMQELISLENRVAEIQTLLGADDAALKIVQRRKEARCEQLLSLSLPNNVNDVLLSSENQATSSYCLSPQTSMAICLSISAIFLINITSDSFTTCRRKDLIVALSHHIMRAESHLSDRLRMWLLYITRAADEFAKSKHLHT